MYKSKKYNSILILLVLVISIVVGVSAGMTTITPVLDDIIDDNNGGGFVDDNPLPGGLKKPGDGAGAFERVDFAFKIMNEGKGYTSVGQQAITAVNQVQYVKYKRYQASNFNVVKEWYKMDGALAEIGKNEFLTRWTDDTIMKNLTIYDRKEFDYNATTYNPNAQASRNQTTVHEWVVERNFMKVNQFFTPINKTTAYVVNYDNKAYDKSYYTVRLGLDNSKLDRQFLALFDNIGASNVKIGAITVVLRIDKKTGYLQSYEVSGKVHATYLAVTAEVGIMFKETFTKMNADVKSEIDSIYEKTFKNITNK